MHFSTLILRGGGHRREKNQQNLNVKSLIIFARDCRYDAVNIYTDTAQLTI